MEFCLPAAARLLPATTNRAHAVDGSGRNRKQVSAPKNLIPMVLFAIILPNPALPQDLSEQMKSMQAASNLASIISSEQACGLQYDQSAIQDWIDANVAASDMDFPSTLATMSMGVEAQIAMMSPSAKTAHCRAVERTARHYGFTK